MGWFKNLLNKIRGIEALPEGQPQTYHELPNTMAPYTIEGGAEMASNVAQQAYLNKHREALLNQLGNSATLLARGGMTLSTEGLIQFAEQRGGFPIDIEAENRVVKPVDVQAAIQVGYAVASGYVNEPEINSVGGMAHLINEMSVRAEKTASEYQVTADHAADYLSHPRNVIDYLVQQQKAAENEIGKE